MADRRRNRGLHHITDLHRLGGRLLVALIVIGAIPGYVVVGRALLHAFRGG